MLSRVKVKIEGFICILLCFFISVDVVLITHIRDFDRAKIILPL